FKQLPSQTAQEICKQLDNDFAWNADCVGAFNILRLYLKQKEIDLTFDAKSISHPYVLKVAA
ncbi:hypothetical protein LI091_14740, partial [Blautia sp. MSK20_18]|uniref:hypothetical protein n=1 Tax=Blautia sp. MSK20_18 TaxID=2883186 RepID=UPI002F3E9447|nr:hypothetical protein [Blautia sp. MSK20_18]